MGCGVQRCWRRNNRFGRGMSVLVRTSSDHLAFGLFSICDGLCLRISVGLRRCVSFVSADSTVRTKATGVRLILISYLLSCLWLSRRLRFLSCSCPIPQLLSPLGQFGSWPRQACVVIAHETRRIESPRCQKLVLFYVRVADHYARSRALYDSSQSSFRVPVSHRTVRSVCDL